jgi:hypothetical protein
MYIFSFKKLFTIGSVVFFLIYIFLNQKFKPYYQIFFTINYTNTHFIEILKKNIIDFKIDLYEDKYLLFAHGPIWNLKNNSIFFSIANDNNIKNIKKNIIINESKTSFIFFSINFDDIKNEKDNSTKIEKIIILSRDKYKGYCKSELKKLNAIKNSNFSPELKKTFYQIINSKSGFVDDLETCDFSITYQKYPNTKVIKKYNLLFISFSITLIILISILMIGQLIYEFKKKKFNN